MKTENILKLIGEFSWDFGQKFFIETSEGNFVWSDPNYGGDNTIRPYKGSLEDYFKGRFSRDKGKHFISDYCGEKILFIEG